MLLALLMACLPPTTFGLRSDGTLGPPRTVELSAGAGGVLPRQGDNGVLALGGQAAYTVARDVAITAGGAWPTSGGLYGLELGARTRLLGAEEGPLLTSVEGLSSVRSTDGGLARGAQLGLIGSPGLQGSLRPYLGLLVNPTWSDGDHWFYSDLGLGASFGAPAGERVDLRCTAELDWSYDWTDSWSTFGGVLLVGIRLRPSASAP